MFLTDSNILIAFFRPSEIHHKKAKNIINQSNTIVLTDYVLGEVYTVLSIRESYEVAKEALNWIMENQKTDVTRLSRNEIEQTIDFLDDHKTRLSFVDASLIIVSANRNLELLSFDDDLNKVKNRGLL